jgi:RNA polymerase sigma factor (sigma-70 family)
MSYLSLSTLDETLYTKDEIKRYTNEQLVQLIHEYNNNKHWELLWIKTKRTIYKVWQKDVNSYYQDQYQDEIFSILLQGWIHAINTYDENKATGEFYKYAIYIIRQHYKIFVRRISPESIGKSVRYSLLEDYTTDDSEMDILNSIADEESLEVFNVTECKLDILNNLEKLKKDNYEAYLYIIEYYFEEKTQSMIAEKYDTTAKAVRNKIREGLRKLAYYFKIQDKLSA